MLAARPSPTRSASGGVEPSIELTAEGLWSEVSSRLRGALNETTYRTWFNHVEGLELNDDEFVLAVPNDFTRDWIEGHFIGLISAAVGDATGRERRITAHRETVAGAGAGALTGASLAGAFLVRWVALAPHSGRTP